MGLTGKIKGLTSNRERPVEQPKAPTHFEKYGGWAAAAASGRLDLQDSEREQRKAGAEALAKLESDKLAERRAQRQADIEAGRFPRGRTYGERP